MRALKLGCWLLIFASAAGGCYPRGQFSAVQTPARKVGVVVVRSEPVERTASLIGRIEPWRETTLYFEVAGVVEEVFVDEGNSVEAGDPIARLVIVDFELDLSKAEAERDAAAAQLDLLETGTRKEDLAAAEAELKAATARATFWIGELGRREQLFRRSTITDTEMAEARREHDASKEQQRAAQAMWERAVAGPRKEDIAAAAAQLDAAGQAVALAKRQLEKATLVAPFSASVENRLVDPGAYINVFPTGGVPVVHLVDLRRADAIVAVPEAMLPAFTVGRPIEIVSAVNPMARTSADIVSVSQVADRGSGTFSVRARFDNPAGLFRGGMVIHAKSMSRDSQPEIRVPVVALRRALGQPAYVMTVDPETSKVATQNVELGPVHGDQVSITAGLGGGELLVVRGQHFVVAGDRVQPERMDAAVAQQGPGQP